MINLLWTQLIYILFYKIDDAVMLIPITQCFEPDESRLLRKVDTHFVKLLKERMLQDPTAPGVPPLALLCKNSSNKEVVCIIHN